MSPTSIERALRIFDAFVRASEARGFAIAPPDSQGRHRQIIVDGVGIALEFTERAARVPYRPTKQEQRRAARGMVHLPKYTFLPTGELSFSVPHTRAHGGRRKWKDHPRRPLETQLKAVMLGLRDIAAGCREYDRSIAEQDRRIDAFHQSRADLEDRIEREREAVEHLEAEAEAWRRAGMIRAYVASVEAQGERALLAAWASWARDQADRIDPLMPSPPSILDTP